MAKHRVKGNLVQSLSISRLQEASGRPCTLEVPHLVDDDVVDIHLELCQLLDKTLCLIKAQELRYADANKCRQVRVFELLVHLLHNILQTRQLKGLRESRLDPGTEAAFAVSYAEHKQNEGEVC